MRDFEERLAADRLAALSLLHVSRETLHRLDHYVDLFRRWQKSINLVSPATLPVLWTRHVVDSLQVLTYASAARRWVDIGSGGGFPGIVLAIALAEYQDGHVHLVESNGKKGAFLRQAVRETGASGTVIVERIETAVALVPKEIDVVTARAVAPLEKLLALAYPLLKTGARGLFHKGQDVEAELTEASKYWKFQHRLWPSVAHSDSVIMEVTGLEPLR